MKRLYTVSIEAEFMAFAESPSAARALVRSFLAMEGIDEDDCSADPSGRYNANGWDDDCLVYGPEGDMTVAEARRLSETGNEPPASGAPVRGCPPCLDLSHGPGRIREGEDPMSDIKDLIGLTLDEMLVGKNGDGNDQIAILASGRWFVMAHAQDCCERVCIEDVPTLSADTRGAKIVSASEDITTGGTEYGDTFTATFYRILTEREDIALTWRGTSNGYYSESVDFSEWGDDEAPSGRSLFGGAP